MLWHSIQNSGTQSRHLSQDFAEWLGKRFLNSKVLDFAFFRIWIWNVKKKDENKETQSDFLFSDLFRRRSWNGHGELARVTKSELAWEYARCIHMDVYYIVYISYIHGPGIIPICSLLYDVWHDDIYVYNIYIFCIYIYTIDRNALWIPVDWWYEHLKSQYDYDKREPSNE